MKENPSIAFIGGGNMASALAGGLAGRLIPPGRIHVIDVNEAVHADWRARGIGVAAAPNEALAACDVWVYAVKPQLLREVVEQTRPWLRDQLVVSIAAGVRSDTLAAWLGGDGVPWARLVRCMPNTPALVGAGVTGMMAVPGVGDDDRDFAGKLMQAVGEVVWVRDDAELDTVTALSGSGPAYVFLFLQALIDGGVAGGLSPEQARTLALATMAGATRLAAESDETPDTLRERVTSKGGTTAAALAVMGERDLAGTVRQAMQAAAARARELGDALAG